MENDFVVQGSAEERMRMTDDGTMSRVVGASIEQRLQATCGAVQEKRANG